MIDPPRSSTIASNSAAAGASNRLILLGASNLTRCLPTAISEARSCLRSPVECYIAAGHGRSYGKFSRVLGRGLPGILECGVWDALREAHRRDPLPSFAVITDIGNDIMYGVTAQTIAEWVERCVLQLREIGARIVITQLPLASIATVGPRRFALVKAIMFPTHDIAFSTAIERARELAARIEELAQRHEAGILPQPLEWFGFDAIHIRPRCKRAAWSAFCSPQNEGDAKSDGRFSLARRVRLRLATPRRWWLLGREFGREQPSALLPDGSRIHLY